MKKLPDTVAETARAVREREITISELVEATLDNISRWEPRIDAFIEVLGEEALAAAKKMKPDSTQTLSGVPIGLKDIICTIEGHTTAASNMLSRFRSPYEATVVSRLKKAGAVVIGKLNLDAFAMGVSTEYSDFKVTKNPWDTSKVPGGSSGGSAAAVASGEIVASLGTDTGGSIRHPSSLCGVVGLKPTYGRVSRFGVIAYGSSLDQVGPVARTVKDAALICAVIAGQDKRDATSAPERVGDYSGVCGQSIKGIKIGVAREFFTAGVEDKVAREIRKAIALLATLGAEIVDISLPLTPAGVPVYYLIAKAEGSTNLGRYDAIRFNGMDLTATSLIEHYLEARGKGFGLEVKRTILMGTYALSAGYYDAWYKQASKVRTMIRQEFQDAFSKVDVIVGPTTPETAWPIGTRADDPLAMYMADALTVTASLSGLPAMSVPAGFVAGLPIGLQLIAPHFEEERLFKVGYAFEQVAEKSNKKPVLPK